MLTAVVISPIMAGCFPSHHIIRRLGFGFHIHDAGAHGDRCEQLKVTL
ncbi:hypothetical protein EDWATA_01570 [Edwardsiella tarda ATCC 23685]|uniref:Uncharacterized protein n=1 Tax=Edwardsiella tarda ATCC 23685 TaxID=500638 RepID=D4F499_EDWTA|nr:hypothetical protein EDWATA_01570 [Edwardsiella tarda ATCC 23685]